MADTYEYDLVVIGSGPAGEKGAAQAAYFGKKVAIVERSPVIGGASINTGTIPSKTLRETALYFSGLHQRGLYGIDYSLKEDLNVSELMYREHMVVVSEWEIIQNNLDRHRIDLVHGMATLWDPHTVRVQLSTGGERDLRAEIILIATGSSPYRPPDIPFSQHSIYDSDSILRMDRIPKSMAIVGGGVIGSEYACIFTALGVEVMLIDSRERLLPFVDAEIAERLRGHLEKMGLRFLFNTRLSSVEPKPNGVLLSLSTGETLMPETVLLAAGRQSNVDGMGLEALGIKMGQRGLILVNDKYQTSIPNIYAAGDVIGFPALASTSMEQARVAMVYAFGLGYKAQVSPVVPLAIYTIPEISMVGLSEEDCRKQNIPCLVGRALYSNNARGQIIGDTSGMVKLLFRPDDKKLLGIHIIGEMASELIHLGAHELAHAGYLDVFINSVYNFPTLSDAYKYAAYDGLGQREKWLTGKA